MGQRDILAWGTVACVLLAALAVLFGLGAYVLLPAIFASLAQAMSLSGQGASFIDRPLRAKDARFPLSVIELAVRGAVEDSHEIAEHIKSSTELGVLSAAESAAEITARISARDDELIAFADELSRCARESLIPLLDEHTKHFDLLREHLDAITAELSSEGEAASAEGDDKIVVDVTEHSFRERMASWSASFEEALVARGAELRCGLDETQDRWDRLAQALHGDREVMRDSSHRILIELQFQDKIRQEVERLQHGIEVPLQALSELAQEIAEGTLPEELCEARTTELCHAIFNETKAPTAHSLCADAETETGELEMF